MKPNTPHFDTDLFDDSLGASRPGSAARVTYVADVGPSAHDEDGRGAPKNTTTTVKQNEINGSMTLHVHGRRVCKDAAARIGSMADKREQPA